MQRQKPSQRSKAAGWSRGSCDGALRAERTLQTGIAWTRGTACPLNWAKLGDGLMCGESASSAAAEKAAATGIGLIAPDRHKQAAARAVVALGGRS
jgi:hypothetical protein